MTRDSYAPLTLENLFRTEVQIYFVLRFITTGKVRKSRSTPKSRGSRENREVGSVVW
jgi:hypothetical protein